MNRFWTAGLCVLLLTSGVALAMQNLSANNERAQQIPKKNIVKGTLKDVKLSSVTVERKEGKMVELTVDKNTVIKRRGKRIHVTDLKVGEIVMAAFVLEEEIKKALRITVVAE